MTGKPSNAAWDLAGEIHGSSTDEETASAVDVCLGAGMQVEVIRALGVGGYSTAAVLARAWRLGVRDLGVFMDIRRTRPENQDFDDAVAEGLTGDALGRRSVALHTGARLEPLPDAWRSFAVEVAAAGDPGAALLRLAGELDAERALRIAVEAFGPERIEELAAAVTVLCDPRAPFAPLDLDTYRRWIEPIFHASGDRLRSWYPSLHPRPSAAQIVAVHPATDVEVLEAWMFANAGAFDESPYVSLPRIGINVEVVVHAAMAAHGATPVLQWPRDSRVLSDVAGAGIRGAAGFEFIAGVARRCSAAPAWLGWLTRIACDEWYDDVTVEGAAAAFVRAGWDADGVAGGVAAHRAGGDAFNARASRIGYVPPARVARPDRMDYLVALVAVASTTPRPGSSAFSGRADTTSPT